MFLSLSTQGNLDFATWWSLGQIHCHLTCLDWVSIKLLHVKKVPKQGTKCTWLLSCVLSKAAKPLPKGINITRPILILVHLFHALFEQIWLEKKTQLFFFHCICCIRRHRIIYADAFIHEVPKCHLLTQLGSPMAPLMQIYCSPASIVRFYC